MARNFKVGDLYRVGGNLGPIEKIIFIYPNGDMILDDIDSDGINFKCRFYYHPGDCRLIRYKPKLYEQLSLF